jgi:hypothetical protein
MDDSAPHAGGRKIVLTAPLTEIIDHAGYFIQMSMASLPIWLERILNDKYPKWRDVEYDADGSARYMPAGLRVVEASLLRRFPPEDIVCSYPADLHKFVGPRTRVVAVSTHNPLGVTFAAGVYTSIFGSSREPINSHYARQLFAAIEASPFRDRFKVIVGGSGGWQIVQTDSYDELGVDCVIEGTEAEWTGVHVAVDDVRGRRPRAASETFRQAARRPAVDDQKPQRAARQHQTASVAAPARRHRRSARRVHRAAAFARRHAHPSHTAAGRLRQRTECASSSDQLVIRTPLEHIGAIHREREGGY